MNRVPRQICVALSQTQTEGGRHACVNAGRRIEAASQNNLETLFALAIQRRAIRESGWADAQPLLARVEARLDVLLRLGQRFGERVHTHQSTAAFWRRYYDIFVAQNEEAAIRFALGVRDCDRTTQGSCQEKPARE